MIQGRSNTFRAPVTASTPQVQIKNKKIIRSDSFSLPIGEQFTLDNYRTAFERVNILGAYRNSIVISV